MDKLGGPAISQQLDAGLAYAQNIPKKPGAIMDARETAARIHHYLNEICAAAGTCADRLLGGVPEAASGAKDVEGIRFCGEAGDLHETLHAALKAAEKALEEVRRFDRL